MFEAVRVSTVRRVMAPCAVAIAMGLAAPASAQNEDALRSFFEGKRVTLKIDMPGTSDGVDVTPNQSRAIDYRRYGDRLKAYGTAIRAGDSATVTLVKVKKDLIEFQLGGGGFGTFADDSSTSVYIPSVSKSNREKDLEKTVKDEPDSRRKREMERELDDLRDRRERENRRIEAERARAEDRKRERIAQDRLRGGSRFNLRFVDAVPARIHPEEVMAALAEYVEFSFAEAYVDLKPAVASLDPEPDEFVLPRKGMTRADAERAFGKAVDASERREGTFAVTTLVFVRREQRITAEFVEDVLVRYTLTSK